MEELIRSYGLKATKKFNVKDYFERYSKFLESSIDNQNFNCQAASSSQNDFDDKEFERLSEICNVDNLKYPGEEETKDEIVKMRKNNPDAPPIVSNTTSLETLKHLAERYSNYQAKRIPLKYLSEIPVKHQPVAVTKNKIVPGEDILYFIRIYNPFKYEVCPAVRSRRKITLSRVINILGRQTLADLRDKIDCVSDLSVVFEASENPEATDSLFSNKERYNSAFFFIENTFYNDMRVENNQDNSTVIREWAKTKNTGQFDCAKMEDTRLDSLHVKFCYPWLYQHQGSCEHLVVFSDARLIHADDHLDVANWPRVERMRTIRSSSCMLCTIRPVYWIVTESDRVPHNPCYFCKPCFTSFNYANGKKLGAFKAYRYPYDPELVANFRSQSIKEEPMDED